MALESTEWNHLVQPLLALVAALTILKKRRENALRRAPYRVRNSCHGIPQAPHLRATASLAGNSTEPLDPEVHAVSTSSTVTQTSEFAISSNCAWEDGPFVQNTPDAKSELRPIS